jgi:hypothetical protein
VPVNGLALLIQEHQNAGYREDQFRLSATLSTSWCHFNFAERNMYARSFTPTGDQYLRILNLSVSQRSFAQANPLTANEWCKWAPSPCGLVRSSFAIVGEKPIKGELK